MAGDLRRVVNGPDGSRYEGYRSGQGTEARHGVGVTRCSRLCNGQLSVKYEVKSGSSRSA